MSDFIRVFCRLPEQIPSENIEEFVDEGAYFDETPAIEVERRAADGSWESIAIRYDPSRRPIILWCNVDDGLLREEVDEILEELRNEPLDAPPARIADRLRSSTVAYAFEVDAEGLGDEAWAMVDSLEAHLARECDGIVYAPGDGFFDAELRPILSLRG